MNIFKKVKRLTNDVKQSMRDPQQIVMEIHRDFDSACDELLAEAEDILKRKNDDKGQRLKRLGFTSCSDAVKAIELDIKKQRNEALIPLIERYKTFYPLYKFIEHKQVESICQKYGLVFGGVSNFIGDIPEKNISEIEEFKLLDDDKEKIKNNWFQWKDREGYVEISGKPKKQQPDHSQPFWGCRFHTWHEGYDYITRPEDEDFYLHADMMRICATKKDFKTERMMLASDGFTLINIPDPVVLQPVEGGYLIVTKWGLEGQDESLINEKMN